MRRQNLFSKRQLDPNLFGWFLISEIKLLHFDQQSGVSVRP
jgi:hypothetical protein